MTARLFAESGNDTPTGAAWRVVSERLVRWPATVREQAVTPQLSGDEIVARLQTDDFARARDLPALVEAVADVLERGTVHATHPRYFGLFNPGVRRAGVIADTLAAIYNLQVGAWWHAPAANVIERLALEFFATRLGIASNESGAMFTTGGSEANLTGVLAALAAAFPEFLRDGLAGIGSLPVLYASDQAHDSFVKIARATGLGERAVHRVKSDDHQRMDVASLRRAVAADRGQGRAPFLVIATVGTTATGAIDPLGELAAFCRSERLWLHADAAWGGLAVLSHALRRYVAGLELADSITCDAHKILPVPMGVGMFFCRARRFTDDVFSVHTGYVPDAEPGTEDPYQHTLQWSRRCMGLKVFLTLAELGASGVAALVEHQAAMAQLLREQLSARGWRVMNDTPLPLVCFTRDDLPAAAVEPLARAVAEEGIAWISAARLPTGECWLRACITNADTVAEDVRELVEAVTRAYRTRSS
jgi:aromatic-L-amino-acid/L-tryptophan decarboxylase